MFHGVMKKLAVLVLIAAGIGGGRLVADCYQQSFEDWARVTVVADRTGLVMDRGAKVTMSGVTVGEVTAIHYDSDRAELTLRLHKSALASIPADVRADITSTTVFGAKFVSFTAPARPTADRLRAGARIDISQVTVELNTVFEQLTHLLTAFDPAQLNASLSALDRALQGRGAQLGSMLDNTATALAQLNSADPGLDRLLPTAAAATGVYADVAPDLLHMLSALTTTGTTVVQNRTQLAALLSSTAALSNTGTDLLAGNAESLEHTLQLLTPTTGLLALYAPEIPCVFHALQRAQDVNSAAYTAQPGIKMYAGLIPGSAPYHYPQDLPKVNATGGPHCMGLPDIDPVVNVPYMVTDIGVNPFDPSRQGTLAPPDLLGYLFGIGGTR